MKYLLHFSRLFVGNLFIFSGVVKANDPLGFSYKLEEYFHEFGMHWSFLDDILVPLAAILCIVEIVLGVAVLVGYKMKLVSWSLLLMIVFFTILTGASAIFEIVRSCGCFGDAIPLTPWQSFYKDLILLGLIGVIFVKRKEIEPWKDIMSLMYVFIISTGAMFVLANMLEWDMEVQVLILLWLAVLVKWLYKKKDFAAPVAMVISLAYSLYLCIWSINHLPFKDFRPYAIGKSIPEQMVLPLNAKPAIYENRLTYKNTQTGEEKSFNDEEYTASQIWKDKDWEWVSTDSKLIQEGDEPKITDLSILAPNGEDITERVLGEPNVLLVIMYDFSKTEIDKLEGIVSLYKELKNAKMRIGGMSSANNEENNAFRLEHGLEFPFMTVDGIVLKTIVRSNPGLIFIDRGVVKGKWHINDLPSAEEIVKLLSPR
ncbi:MAG: DoxX family protein [Verrucomicrobia bacterium]|nr:DoxX family protein [Verrucomicrobiota bacterium]